MRKAYVIDPNDPRAPSHAEWEAMTVEERAWVEANLPSEFPPNDASPPEGDDHFNSKAGAKDALRGYFERIKRRVYLACELPVYYPGEMMFAPDLIAVVDVELHPRQRWLVDTEKKGVDFALEVHVLGNRRKDLVLNAEKYARLGIDEYFIFDRGRLQLIGYRLPRGGRVYQPILPQAGRYGSQTLGLDLGIVDDRLRFFAGTAEVPESFELIGKLEGMMGHLEQRLLAAEERAEEQARRAEEETRRAEEETRRAEEETRRAEEETRRAEEETRRAEAAEKRLAEALAELERLKR